MEIAHRLCRVLDETGEHFAEWGIDLALDRSGHLWIIEANVIPTFKGFAALDGDLYRRLLAAPMRYAADLAGFGGE
jgi:glutathione synthase/RimK-type ligase-like ATP-grasp enzyme